MRIILLFIASLMFTASTDVKLCRNNKVQLNTQPFAVEPLIKWTSNRKRQRRKWSSPILYYRNDTKTFRLLISGDVETNPGPVCSTCKKAVRSNSRRFVCEICRDQTHQKCANGLKIKIPNSRIPATWTCTTCSLSYLPFFHVRDLNAPDILIEPEIHANVIPEDQHPYDDPHLNIFSRKGTKIGHLNTQSISSTFTEFEKLMNTYKFDIMTLSETWLRDDKNLLKHVQIPRYQSEYNHRATRGGGIGMYICNEIKYKLRNDIVRLDPDIEHLWIEVKVGTKIILTY